MENQEFKTQIFKTQDQWQSGLLYRLEVLEEGGITLYSTPGFVQWIEKIDGLMHPCGLAVDECGQIYFIDSETCWLYRYAPETRRLEKLPCIGGCGTDPGNLVNPTRMIMDKFTLWVADTGNRRVQAFSRENYQIKYIINGFEEPVDLDLDLQGNLYILDGELKQIFKYETNGNFIKRFGESNLKEPVGLALGKENKLYVVDRAYAGFLLFTEQGEYSGLIGDFNKISTDFKPSTIAIDKKGKIFVGDDETEQIHLFDSDGSHVGIIDGFTGVVCGLATDLKGNLYVSCGQGIALLSTLQTYTKSKGCYYSRTLDSGIQKCEWHRLVLDSDMPPKTILEVSYHASDDSSLKNMINEILANPEQSIQAKAESIDGLIPWNEPVRNTRDMLLRGKTGRYLWLKLELATLDEKVKPTITQMTVYYPRISYLRYLPAIYQENPLSKDFLERFLSIFESLFNDVEAEICHVFEYFDPDTAPQDFLTWLASWLNFALEEDWPEAKKRQFIRQASTLFKLKGTVSGIEAFIQTYTGKKPLIQEHSRIGKHLVLDGDYRLGINSLLMQTPIRGFRLGDDSILGRVALRDVAQSPGDPFLPAAHRFAIIISLSSEELNRYEKGIKRILNEEKPAHTVYTLRFVNDMRIGMNTYVGISTRVCDYLPFRLGNEAAIGSRIVVMEGEDGGRVERHATLEKDTKLI